MTIKKLSIAAIGAALMIAPSADAGTDPYLGEILITPYTFCPRGTTGADGQLLPISQYSALFSLYGTIYGGDGETTFGLPELRGRTPIHSGSGPGLASRPIGSRSGTETNTMTVTQMPSHTHRAGLRTRGNETANSTTPRKNSFANAAGNTYIDGAAPTGKFMNANTLQIDNEGGNQAQNNMQPFQTLRYCVSLVGVYPSRN